MLSADKLDQLGEPFYCEFSSLAGIREALTSIGETNDIPLEFEHDQVKSGGLLSRQVDDCLVVFHPKHPNDYFRFCVMAKQQGPRTFVRVYSFGTSRQAQKESIHNRTREDRRGKSLSYKLGNVAVSSLLTTGRSKAKLEEEQDYYSLVRAAFAEVLK